MTDALLSQWSQRHPSLADDMARVLPCSRYARAAARQLLDTDDDCEDFLRSLRPSELGERIAELPADDADIFMQVLRRLRNRYLLRLLLRDLCGRAPLDETLRDLSDLADACVTGALEFARRGLVERYGVPRNGGGEEIQAVVLGMGKLGGRELNFSSDIDLIFCHTAQGETDGTRQLSADEFFAKLAQETARLLVTRTADGFVYRVDTMLRPFGSAGALSASFGAMEEYYQVHGREWERYALIKARPVAGDIDAGHRLLKLLQPFVYRRYLDYGAIGNLRALKALIEDEVARKGLEDDVKLGAGGIREVEFIVQSFQLVRGGAEPALRDSRLRPVLRYLGQQGHLDGDVAARLDTAYVFLRRLENAIQMYDDQQTHALPQDEERRNALMTALRCDDWLSLEAQLNDIRAYVHGQFSEVFAAEQAAEQKATQKLVGALWNATLTGDDALQALYEFGYGRAPQQVLAQIDSLRQTRLVRAMREQTAARLQRLLGYLFDEALQQAAPETALVRTLRVIEAVAGRSTYLVLLDESQQARDQLLRLCGASPWLAAHIARAPIVLDSLLDARSLYEPPQRAEMVEELRVRSCDVEIPADTERVMNVLRHYQQEVTLRVAAADLVGALPVVKVSDRLTWLGEVIVERALDFVRQEMTAQYGRAYRSDGSEAGFGVVAYGKFGGIEMGYGSDLDLVFLHDCDQIQSETVGGNRALDANTYFARLAQRLIHWLSTRTTAGRAYEVDMELRPNGRSGMLVASIERFTDYQLHEAWTWEHQALTRARFICGDPRIAGSFNDTRRAVLTKKRDTDKLRGDIVEMRDKMRVNLDKSTEELWDVKQGRGGLVDIEFITQYLVLRHAHGNDAVVEWSDNWRQLEALRDDRGIATEDMQTLIDCYRSLRDFGHTQALQDAPMLAPTERFRQEREQVTAIWSRVMALDV